jgi:hypothetical protein
MVQQQHPKIYNMVLSQWQATTNTGMGFSSGASLAMVFSFEKTMPHGSNALTI